MNQEKEVKLCKRNVTCVDDKFDPKKCYRREDNGFLVFFYYTLGTNNILLTDGIRQHMEPTNTLLTNEIRKTHGTLSIHAKASVVLKLKCEKVVANPQAVADPRIICWGCR
ncbi:hypothetical protein Hanom_Chr16g01424091 [Helianthus anomalus]